MPTVCFATLGCKVNQVDTAHLEELFRRAGYDVVAWPGPADVCVVNTCTVTARADRQSRQAATRARRLNPEGLVVVTGCAPMSGGGRSTAFADADLITGNAEKDDLPELVAGLEKGEGRRLIGAVARSDRVPAGGACRQHRARAFLKVQDGCPARCAYCIVPSVRGPHRSLPRARVVAAVEELVTAGYREVVLTGIHLGLFGADHEPPDDLAGLCRGILRETALPRLRLSSLEPREVTAALLELPAAEPRFCPHLHIPLQSGSDCILRAMNRPYDTTFYAGVVESCRAAVPDITLGADVLVGFPGEDETAFADTMAFLERLRLPHLHVFPYSDRPGTAASVMPGKVPRRTVLERAGRIREMAARIRRDYLAGYRGRWLAVLVERAAGGSSRGLSRNYLPVRFPGHCRPGTEVWVEVTDLDEREMELIGEPQSAPDTSLTNRYSSTSSLV